MPFDFKRRLSDLEVGDHLYLLYADGDERSAGLAPAMEEAFHRGHRCLYFAGEEGMGEALRSLRARGVAVDEKRDAGALRVRGFEGRDLLDGALEPETIVDGVLEEADEAEADGFPGLWWIVEIPWYLRSGVRGEHIQAFEAQLFDRLPGSRVVAVCQFDRRELTEELLATVLEGHPLAVLGDQVYPNPFYVPPRAVLDEYEMSRTDWMLRRMDGAREREAQLERSQRRLETLLERAPAVIARFDRELRCVYANPRIEEYAGLTPGERVGKTPEEAGLDTDAAAPWYEGMRRALETGEEQVVAGPYRTPRGKRWLRATIVPEPGPDGEPESVLTLAQDITDEKEARRRAEEASQLFRKTVASLDEAVFVIRPESREILYCNPAAEEMFGYGRSELVGRSTRMLHVDEESFHRFAEESERALTERDTYEGAFRVRREDGTTFPSEHVVTLLNPAEGLEGGVVSVVRDVTEERDAREALELYAERLEHLRELDRAILGARSEEEVLASATSRIRELLGSWRASVILRSGGGEGARLVTSSTEDEGTRIRPEGATSGEARLLERLEREGALREAEVSEDWEPLIPAARELVDRGLRSCFAVPLLADGRVVGSLNVGYDQPAAFGEMTVELAGEMATHLGLALRQARLLEEVDEATARRRAAEERLARIGIEERKRIGRELHDQLGQQLTGIAFLARTLADRLKDEGGAAAEIASEARDAIARLRHLTRGLDPGALDDQGLPDAIEELAGEGRRLFGVEVETGVDPGVAVGEDEVLHLYRIAQEALTNAVRHGGASRVRIELRGDDDARTFEVRDDGSGMADDVDGKGIGLRSMRYRCELIGGELEVASEVGSGTRITCRLPAHPVPASTRSGLP